MNNLIHKPVAFADVSDGSWGGVRAIEARSWTVRELEWVSTFTPHTLRWGRANLK